VHHIQVIIRWHEAGIRVRASIALPAAANEDALPSMLATLFQSFAAMQAKFVLSSSLFSHGQVKLFPHQHCNAQAIIHLRR
jgi:hypothetical protein